jgi:hypothetical protein
MKMKKIIDGISELYREQLDKERELHKELMEIEKKIFEADLTKGENISHAEYNRLTDRLNFIQDEIDMQNKYCDGIAFVREYLMDLGFDTEVE